MGEVFLVLPPRGEPVALKLLKTLDDENAARKAIDQFENEFKVLKKLSHPNIAQIYDYGYDESLKKVFFTCPWLEGSDIFTATQNLEFEECEEVFVQALRALNYLHQKDLIHCDLKPGNIFVEKGKVILIDFGLAGYFGEFIVGTPTYLAPEIFKGKHHTVASDLYAMGVIFYNCLTRTQPFSGKDLQEVYDRHRTLTPPLLNELNPKVPKYFSDIVATLLNKKPSERFQSAAAVIEELDVFSKKTYTIETEETLLSYLPSESDLIGRKDILLQIQKSLHNFLDKDNSTPYHLILLEGEQNVGKSKVVNKIINDLQLAKISVEKALPPFQENDENVLMSSKAVVFEHVNSYLASQKEAKGLEQFLQLVERKVLASETSKTLLILTSRKESDFKGIVKLFPEETTEITSLQLMPYTKTEMKEFLSTVLGHKEIPQTFVSKFYRNTEGLPGVATLLIQTMIEKGLLFDKSGRWNEDLLVNLDTTFDKLEISESLEQDFEKIYASLNHEEEELVKWLSLTPKGLTKPQLKTLLQANNLDSILNPLLDSSLVRQEDNHYILSRTIFQNFVQENLPEKEVYQRHLKLAKPETKLSREQAIYHLSYSGPSALSLKAAENLAQIYENQGLRDLAIETYQRLNNDFHKLPLKKRIEWILKIASLMIWLDRFQDACDLISEVENEIYSKKHKINFVDFLSLLEKKGLVLKHLQELEKAKIYFENGLKYSQNNEKYKIHHIRFENDLAELDYVMGHTDAAIEKFTKTRSEMQNFTLKEKQEITNNDLGHVYLQKQDFKKCLSILIEDIHTFSKMKNQEPLARALYSMAQALHSLEKIEQAIQSYEKCISICRDLHIFYLLLRTYNGLGNLYFAEKNFEQALNNYQKAIELSVHLQDSTSKAVLLFNQGFIYLNQKNHVLSNRRFLHALQVLENKENKTLYDNLFLSRCYEALANLNVEDNNPMKALGYYIERIRLSEKLDLSDKDRNNYHLDLLELYLLNRLKDPFENEVQNLKINEFTPEQHERLQKMQEEWIAIESFKNQDNTDSLG